MTRIGIVLKPDHSRAQALQAELAEYLRQNGHEVVGTDPGLADSMRIEPAALSTCDLVCTLGGDGTILGVSAALGAASTPVLGINLGRLGFLAAFDSSDAKAALDAAIAGDLPIGTRMRLEVTPPAGPTRHALNDVVIHQGAMARLLELDVTFDGAFVSSYRADGLIVATPTGSTAYNLAAGGPILFPGQEAMTITPVCAHALTNRPLVVPNGSEVTLSTTDTATPLLTVDGQWATEIAPKSTVKVTGSDSPLHLFEPEKSYFDILREKLHWGRQPARKATQC